MATNTTNHGFKKPDESDFYSVQDQNRNWDTADGAFHSLEYPEFEDYTTGTPLPDAEAALAEMKSGKKHTNILSSIKSVLTGAFLKIYILKTMEEVMANTMEGRVADALLVKNINSNLEGYYKLSGGTAIPNGANLTGYKTPGNYYCPNNTVAASLTGSPTKKAFTLKVELSTGNSYPCQTIRDFSTGKIYFRTFNIDTNAWSEWGYSIQSADMESKQITSTTDSNGLVSVGAKYPDYKKVVCTTTRTATIMHVYHNDSEWRAKAVDTSNNAIANTNITINCIAFK